MPEPDDLAAELLDVAVFLETLSYSQKARKHAATIRRVAWRLSPGEGLRVTGPREELHRALTYLAAAGLSVKVSELTYLDEATFVLIARPRKDPNFAPVSLGP